MLFMLIAHIDMDLFDTNHQYPFYALKSSLGIAVTQINALHTVDYPGTFHNFYFGLVSYTRIRVKGSQTPPRPPSE